MSEKTENATPQKLKESRKKGQVAQSQDIPKLLICIGILETIFAMVNSGMERMESMVLLPLMRLREPFAYAMEEVIADSFTVMLFFTAIVCGIAVVLRILGGWIQFGPLFASEALAPKFDSLNPVNQIKNMFSLKQLSQLLTSFVKAVVIGIVIWMTVVPELEALARLAHGTLDSFWQGVMDLLIKVARRVLILLLALSVIDFGIQKYFFLKDQRMSHEDIKNEFKNNEGDPHMKGHRREVANEILNEEPKAPVRKADVDDADMLLINPTHYAVGLYYRPGETPLPKLLFKASDEDAQELIAHAQRINKPVIRFIWLTRTLYRTTEEGAFIPRETIKAVAQVYKILRELEEHYLEEDEIIEVKDE